MKSNALAGRLLFAIAWIGVGIQHYMYAEFVATIVPPYMPGRLAWAYITGTSMIVAGIALLINFQRRLVCLLLGSMMICFLLMVHPLILTAKTVTALNWTRFFQDISITGAAFYLSGERRVQVIARYVYAIPLLILGGQHFVHAAFETGQIPEWMPLRLLLDDLMGILLIVGGLSMAFVPRYMRLAGLTVGWTLFIFILLLFIPLLAIQIRNGQIWSWTLVDLMTASGALILTEREPSFHRQQLVA